MTTHCEPDHPDGIEQDTLRDALTSTATLLGKKWHPLIIYLLSDDGPLGFADMQDELSDISSKVLSENLTELENRGLLVRRIIDERPIRVEYSLTARGESLTPIILDMTQWGRRYVVDEAASGD
jgi:DNA-binding HxlR family transcriptional regulator